MNSRMMILSIALTVLSAIITFLLYYGIVRLLQVKTGNTEKYAKEYLKLPKAQTDRKIVVSITGDSMDKLRGTVNSIFDQTVRPDQIIISVPPNSDIKLDEFVAHNNLITVHRLAKDYSRCSNIISPLIREKDGGVLIILVDQDTVYGADFIESIVEDSEKNPDCVIYVESYNAKTFSNTGKKVKENGDVLETSRGVLIKPRFFKTDVLEDSSFYNDPDVFLSVQLHKNNVCMKKMDYTENFTTKSHVDSKLAIDFNAINLPSFN